MIYGCICMSGKIGMGGQEHVYMETQAVVAVPEESNEMTIWGSTQSPDYMQRTASLLLACPRNKIIAKVKRVG